MKKRKERIEKWRAEKKKKEMEALHDQIKETKNSIAEGKAWNLENDDDTDEEENGNGEKDDDESEDDPLDAYMNEISKEVKKFRPPPPKKPSKKVQETVTADGTKKKAIVIMSGVAKKTNEVARRGELMEQNQDGLEYSRYDFT